MGPLRISGTTSTGLLKTTEEVCGTTRPHRWHRETWWWNEHVEKAIQGSGYRSPLSPFAQKNKIWHKKS